MLSSLYRVVFAKCIHDYISSLAFVTYGHRYVVQLFKCGTPSPADRRIGISASKKRSEATFKFKEASTRAQTTILQQSEYQKKDSRSIGQTAVYE